MSVSVVACPRNQTILKENQTLSPAHAGLFAVRMPYNAVPPKTAGIRGFPSVAGDSTQHPCNMRIPMKTAIDSDGKRPPIPIENGHFGRGSIWAA